MLFSGVFGFGSATKAAFNFNQQINYQGKLTDNTGATVADGVYNIAFNLYDSTQTNILWTSTTTATTTNGLFSYMLGSSSTLSSVDFNQTLYLSVNVGGIGAPSWDGEMTPRKILGSVPAAFEALNAQTLDNLATSSFLRSDQADTIAATTASTLLTITQRGSGDILNLFDDTNEVMTVLDGGNVGIGTTSPYAKLSVAGQIVGQYFTATSTATNTFPTLSVTGALYDSAGTAGANGYVLQTDGTSVSWVATSSLNISSGSTITFGTDNQIPFTNAGGTDYDYSSLFTYNGTNFGVGTSSPLTTADIYGNLALSGSSRYLNFGATSSDSIGTTGYGFRDNAGTIEFKNKSGTWQSVTTATSGPSFSVDRNDSDQTVTASTITLVNWTNDSTGEAFDTNNNFDLSTDRFTPTVPGKYLVTLKVTCPTGATFCDARIRKNGSLFSIDRTDLTSSIATAMTTIIVDMNGTTDYLEAYGYNQGGTTFSGNINYTRFSGAMIAPVSPTGGGWDDNGTYVTLTDNTDKVGIGTSSPAASFDLWGTGTTDIFTVSSSSGDRLITVNSDGNFGIGTTSPAYKFDLYGDARIDGDLFTKDILPITNLTYDLGSSTKRFANLWAETLNVGTSTWSIFNGTDGRLAFSSAAEQGGTEALSILTNGKVGIGESNPTSDLVVQSSGSGQGIRFQSAGDSGTLLLSANASNNTYAQFKDALGTTFVQVHSSGTTYFSGGNVGIRTTSPSYNLDVSGDARFTNPVYVTGNTPQSNFADANVVGVGMYQGGYITANGNNQAGAYIGNTNDGSLIGFYSAGTWEGNISVSGSTISYNAFTGSHYGTTDESIERGELVALTGSQIFKHGESNSEPTYKVAKSMIANAPNVLGSMLGIMEPHKPHDPIENPYLIMAVGNGDVWVADNGDDIAAGDYLISSDVPGHAEKDLGEYTVSHIIAKAAQDVDWTGVTTTVDGIKHTKITVTFEQFDKWHGVFIDPDTGMASTTKGTSTVSWIEFASQTDGLWSRLMELARSFADGVLRLASAEIEYIRSNEIVTDKLCVGDTCLTEAELKALMNNQGVIGASTPAKTSEKEPSSPTELEESAPVTETDSPEIVAGAATMTEDREQPVTATSSTETAVPELAAADDEPVEAEPLTAINDNEPVTNDEDAAESNDVAEPRPEPEPVPVETMPAEAVVVPEAA